MRTDPKVLATIAARLSLALEGRYKTVSELVSDAEALHAAAVDARSALRRGEPIRTPYRRARKVAARYGAVVLDYDGLSPLVLRFTAGPVGSFFPVL